MPGTLVKVVGLSSFISLADARVGVVLKIGDERYCSVCSAPLKDKVGTFVARGCTAPPNCDGIIPLCGDGIIEPGEQCDGAAVGACASATCAPDCTCAP